MGAVGPASASCSFWVVQVPPPQKIIFLTTLSTKDFLKNCDDAEGFRLN
jgi:hypothetical protein